MLFSNFASFFILLYTIYDINLKNPSFLGKYFKIFLGVLEIEPVYIVL